MVYTMYICNYIYVYIYIHISDIRYCTVGVLTLKGFRLISGSVRKWMDIQNPTKGIKVDASSWGNEFSEGVFPKLKLSPGCMNVFLYSMLKGMLFGPMPILKQSMSSHLRKSWPSKGTGPLTLLEATSKL